MRLKIKSAYIGLFLIALMFLSTFAFAGLQGIFYTPSQKEVELPTGNVASYRLSQDQETLLLSQGKTILIYRFNETCEKCVQEKQFLEQMVTNSQNYFSSNVGAQLFLEVLTSPNEPSKLVLASYYGQLELTEINEANFLPALCQLLVSKPIECALRQVE